MATTTPDAGMPLTTDELTQAKAHFWSRTMDPRIRTTCLHCPPDPGAGGHCGWEFHVAGDAKASGAEQQEQR